MRRRYARQGGRRQRRGTEEVGEQEEGGAPERHGVVDCLPRVERWHCARLRGRQHVAAVDVARLAVGATKAVTNAWIVVEHGMRGGVGGGEHPRGRQRRRHLVHLSVTDARKTLVTRFEMSRASFHGNANAPMTCTTHLARVTFIRYVLT